MPQLTKGQNSGNLLTMKFLERTLREIPNVLGSLKKIKLNDLKHRLGIPLSKRSDVDDSDICSKFTIDIRNGWVGRVYKYLVETGGKKQADSVVQR